MKWFNLSLFLINFSIINFSVFPGNDQPALLGGGCTYKSYTGTAQIISVKKERDRSKSGTSYSGYEVLFKFEADEEIRDDWVKKKLSQNQILLLSNSWYPGIKFIRKYKIKANQKIDCVLKVIVEGSCEPIVFEFPDIDLTDFVDND